MKGVFFFFKKTQKYQSFNRHIKNIVCAQKKFFFLSKNFIEIFIVLNDQGGLEKKYTETKAK